MNGTDLLNNLIDRLKEARNYISGMSDHSFNSINKTRIL